MSNQNVGPNQNPVVYAKDSITGNATYVTATGNKLDVNSSGGGGGTQYTDAGTPPAHPVGNAIEWNNAGTWATTGSAAPLPAQVTDGTNIANTWKADGTAAGNNALQVAPARFQTADSNYNVDGTPVKLRVNNQGKLWVYTNDTVNVLVGDQANSSSLGGPNATNEVSTQGLGSASLAVTGTWSGTITFQGSPDQVNYFTITGIDTATGNPVSTTTGNGNYRFNTAGLQTIRVKMTSYVSGSASTFLRTGAGSDGGIVRTDPVGTTIQPISGSVSISGTSNINQSTIAGNPTSVNNGATDTGTQRVTISNDSTGQIKLTDGTNTANILKSDGTAAGQNAQMVAGTYLSVPFTTSTVQAVASTDAGDYRWASVQITSQGGSSTVTFQASNDNSTWVTNVLSPAGNTNGGPTSTSTTTGVWQGPVMGRYFRLNVTGIASGTTAGTLVLSTLSGALNTIGGSVTQSGTWTVGANSATGSAVPANAFYIGVNSGAGNLSGVTSGNGLADANADNNSIAVSNAIFNGTNWDRQRGNQDNISLLASGAQTTTQTLADQTNYNARGVIVTVDVTSNASGSITPEIDMKDPVSGKYVALLTGAAIASSTGTFIYTVYPGATAAANVTASFPLPRTWRVKVTANNANSVTYSVGASVIL